MRVFMLLSSAVWAMYVFSLQVSSNDKGPLLITLPRDTHIIESQFSCGQQQIVTNPCYQDISSSSSTRPPIVTPLGDGNVPINIFLDNYKFISVPPSGNVNITFLEPFICSVVIVPSQQVILSVETLNYSKASLPYRELITTTRKDSTVWVNETIIHRPVNKKNFTLYGILETTVVKNLTSSLKGSIAWHFGHTLNLDVHFLENSEHYRRDYVIMPLDIVNDGYYGFVYYYGDVRINFGVAYNVTTISELVNECAEVQHLNHSLCKFGAFCEDLIYGYHCAWPNIDTSKYLHAQWTPYLPITYINNISSKWVIPQTASCQTAVNKCLEAELEGIPLCKEHATCINLSHDDRQRFECRWSDNNVNNGIHPYLLENCEKYRVQFNWICPSMEKTIMEELTKLDVKNLTDQDKIVDRLKSMTTVLKSTNLSELSVSALEQLNDLTLSGFDSILSNAVTKPAGHFTEMNVKQFLQQNAFIVEQSSLHLARKVTSGKLSNVKQDFRMRNVQTQITRVETSVEEELTLSYSFTRAANVSDRLTLLVDNTIKRSPYALVTSVIHTEDILKTMSNKSTDVNHSNKRLISNIISATFTETVSASINFELHHTFVNASTKRICAYWDLSNENKSWEWREDGCRIVIRNSTAYSTMCSCNHLTHFGILLDASGFAAEITGGHKIALTIVTNLGAIICIGALSIFIFVAVKVLRKDHKSIKFIYISLSFCSLMGNLCFIVGVSRTENRIICSVMTALVHYFFLGAFTWKLLFGLLAVNSVLQTIEFHITSNMKRLLYVVGFTSPAVIVLITGAIRRDSYTANEYCWLSNENYALLAFLIPVVTVIAVNLINIAIIFYVLYRSYKRSVQFKYKSKFHLLFLVQATLCMGFSWVFGLFIFDRQSSVLFSYLFAIFNGLQGVMIFVTLVLVPKRSRTMFKCYMSEILSSVSSGMGKSDNGNASSKKGGSQALVGSCGLKRQSSSDYAKTDSSTNKHGPNHASTFPSSNTSMSQVNGSNATQGTRVSSCSSVDSGRGSWISYFRNSVLPPMQEHEDEIGRGGVKRGNGAHNKCKDSPFNKYSFAAIDESSTGGSQFETPTWHYSKGAPVAEFENFESEIEPSHV